MAANLIPLQLDQSTGNLVAKTIPGSFTTPTGTGFVHVTGSSLDSMALTGPQATAVLSLFSPTTTTQGLVPGSNNVGPTYFLNANGAWTIPTGAGVTSFNTRTGAVTLTSADIGVALGYVAYNGVANPAGFLTS